MAAEGGLEQMAQVAAERGLAAAAMSPSAPVAQAAQGGGGRDGGGGGGDGEGRGGGDDDGEGGGGDCSNGGDAARRDAGQVGSECYSSNSCMEKGRWATFRGWAPSETCWYRPTADLVACLNQRQTH